MSRYLDPEVLAQRVSAKMGGLPFQVVIDVKGKKDQLVLVDGELFARSPDQAATEFRAWGASEYGDLDQGDALAKVGEQIARIEILNTKYGSGRSVAVRSFNSWKEFVGWLGDAKEKVVATTVQLPASLFVAVGKLAKRRKAAGGSGTKREVIQVAVEEYVDRHA